MAEKRLIDADKIYDAVERRYQVSSGIEHRCQRDLLDLICAAETVDAVEVVRCKDCVSFDEQFRTVSDETGKAYCGGYCYHWEHESGMCPNRVDGDDFCSQGERRADG